MSGDKSELDESIKKKLLEGTKNPHLNYQSNQIIRVENPFDSEVEQLLFLLGDELDLDATFLWNHCDALAKHYLHSDAEPDKHVTPDISNLAYIGMAIFQSEDEKLRKAFKEELELYQAGDEEQSSLLLNLEVGLRKIILKYNRSAKEKIVHRNILLVNIEPSDTDELFYYVKLKLENLQESALFFLNSDLLDRIKNVILESKDAVLISDFFTELNIINEVENDLCDDTESTELLMRSLLNFEKALKDMVVEHNKYSAEKITYEKIVNINESHADFTSYTNTKKAQYYSNPCKIRPNRLAQDIEMYDDETIGIGEGVGLGAFGVIFLATMIGFGFLTGGIAPALLWIGAIVAGFTFGAVGGYSATGVVSGFRQLFKPKRLKEEGIVAEVDEKKAQFLEKFQETSRKGLEWKYADPEQRVGIISSKLADNTTNFWESEEGRELFERQTKPSKTAIKNAVRNFKWNSSSDDREALLKEVVFSDTVLKKRYCTNLSGDGKERFLDYLSKSTSLPSVKEIKETISEWGYANFQGKIAIINSNYADGTSGFWESEQGTLILESEENPLKKVVKSAVKNFWWNASSVKEKQRLSMVVIHGDRVLKATYNNNLSKNSREALLEKLVKRDFYPSVNAIKKEMWEDLNSKGRKAVIAADLAEDTRDFWRSEEGLSILDSDEKPSEEAVKDAVENFQNFLREESETENYGFNELGEIGRAHV